MLGSGNRFELLESAFFRIAWNVFFLEQGAVDHPCFCRGLVFREPAWNGCIL